MDVFSFLPPPVVITAAFSFAVVGTLTPGPNNLMLTASGVNFGIRRTLPHMAGINLGCALVQLLTGFGLGTIFANLPILRVILQVLGVAVTLFLAWKVATAGSFSFGKAEPAPMRFWSAVTFQAINGKLWVISISAMSLFVRSTHVVPDVLFVAALMFTINIPIMFLWTGFGARMGDFLKEPARLRVFNLIMGALLALTTLALLRG